MLKPSNLLFIVTVFSTCNYAFVAAVCRLEINLPSPLFSRDFGTKTIVFRAREKEITLDKGESISAHCSTGKLELRVKNYYGYESISYQGERNYPKLECLNNRISINGKSYESIKVSCTTEPNQILYESITSLPKCEGFMSYAIGYQLPPLSDTITAAICYDLEKLQLKYVTYFAYPRNANIFDSNYSEKWVSANLDFKTNGFHTYFKFITTDSISEQIINEFSVENILQDDAIKLKTVGYEYILNTIWWRQLRQENWRFFLEALRQRTDSGQYKYVVSMGTYGKTTLPSALTSCLSSEDEVFTVHTEDVVVAAPAYIWAYVQSRAGTTGEEDFVVIGHNSPYIKDPGHQAFCEFDICDKIDWLKESKFGKLRQLPTLGYTFCCRAEEVANVIDNFPLRVQIEVDGNEVGTTTKTTDDYNDKEDVNNNGENENDDAQEEEYNF